MPTGTSEYWYANCAVPDGASVTGDGGALAGGDNDTDNPLTMVTVRGSPVLEKRASAGYPFAMHGEDPTLVTVTTPVMVPAAPWDWPAVAVT